MLVEGIETRRPVRGQGPRCQLSRRAPEATRSRVLLRCSIHYEKYSVELEAPPKVRPSVHCGWTSRYNKKVLMAQCPFPLRPFRRRGD